MGEHSEPDATLPEYLAHRDKVAIAGTSSSKNQEEAEARR